MSQAFNINARLVLEGPYNVQQVVRSVRSQVEDVPASFDFKMSRKSAQAVSGVSGDAAAAIVQLRGMGKAAEALSRAMAGVKAPEGSTEGLKEIARNLAAFERQAKSARQAIEGVKSQSELAGEVFGVTARKVGAIIVAARAFQAFSQGAGSALSASLAFQNEMTRLSQIGGTTAHAIAGVSAEIGRLATGLGADSGELAKTAVTLRQAGLDADETRVALEALAKTTLAPTFESLKSTTEGVIAMRQQFDVSATDVAARLGAVNTVAGEFAVESEDLVTAIRKAGGAFRSASGDMVTGEQSFNQMLALFTSVRNTTRESADEIATGLRTIFARVQSNSVSNALKEMGVDLRYTAEESKAFGRDVTGQFVGAYEAVRRLSAATRDLPTTDPRYSQIVEQLGGFRQISRVIPLLQQFGTAEKAYQTAQAGANSLTQDAARAQDSFLVKLAKTKETFYDLIRTLSGNKALQQAADLFLRMADGILKVGKALEPVVPLLAAVAAAKTISSLGSFGRGVASTLTNFQGAASRVAHAERVDPAVIRASTVKRRHGGVVPGHGTGDKVPLWAEPGEFVLNRRASQRIGLAALARWNDGGYDRKEQRARFKDGGAPSGGFPIVAEPGEFYFDRKAVSRIGLTRLEAANRTGRLPDGVDADPRERLARKIKAAGGMRATLARFADGGEVRLEHRPGDGRRYPHSASLLQPLDPRERLALKLRAMGPISDAYKDRANAYANGGPASARAIDFDRIKKIRGLAVEGGTMRVDGLSRVRRRFEIDPETGLPTPRAKFYAVSRAARYALGRGFPIPDKVRTLLGRADGGPTDDVLEQLKRLFGDKQGDLRNLSNDDARRLFASQHPDLPRHPNALGLEDLVADPKDLAKLSAHVRGDYFEKTKGGAATRNARILDRVNESVRGTGDPLDVLNEQVRNIFDKRQLKAFKRQSLEHLHSGGLSGDMLSLIPGEFRKGGLTGAEMAIREEAFRRTVAERHKELSPMATARRAAGQAARNQDRPTVRPRNDAPTPPPEVAARILDKASEWQKFLEENPLDESGLETTVEFEGRTPTLAEARKTRRGPKFVSLGSRDVSSNRSLGSQTYGESTADRPDEVLQRVFEAEEAARGRDAAVDAAPATPTAVGDRTPPISGAAVSRLLDERRGERLSRRKKPRRTDVGALEFRRPDVRLRYEAERSRKDKTEARKLYDAGVPRERILADFPSLFEAPASPSGPTPTTETAPDVPPVGPPAEAAARVETPKPPAKQPSIHPRVQRALEEADDKLEHRIFESWGERIAAEISSVGEDSAKTLRRHYFKQARDVEGGGNGRTITEYLLSEEANGLSKEDLIAQVRKGTRSTPVKGERYTIPGETPIGKALALAAVAKQQGVASSYTPGKASAPVAASPPVVELPPHASRTEPPFDPTPRRVVGTESGAVPSSGGGRGRGPRASPHRRGRRRRAERRPPLGPQAPGGDRQARPDDRGLGPRDEEGGGGQADQGLEGVGRRVAVPHPDGRPLAPRSPTRGTARPPVRGRPGRDPRPSALLLGAERRPARGRDHGAEIRRARVRLRPRPHPGSTRAASASHDVVREAERIRIHADPGLRSVPRRRPGSRAARRRRGPRGRNDGRRTTPKRKGPDRPRSRVPAHDASRAEFAGRSRGRRLADPPGRSGRRRGRRGPVVVPDPSTQDGRRTRPGTGGLDPAGAVRLATGRGPGPPGPDPRRAA